MMASVTESNMTLCNAVQVSNCRPEPAASCRDALPVMHCRTNCLQQSWKYGQQLQMVHHQQDYSNHLPLVHGDPDTQSRLQSCRCQQAWKARAGRPGKGPVRTLAKYRVLMVARARGDHGHSSQKDAQTRQSGIFNASQPLVGIGLEVRRKLKHDPANTRAGSAYPPYQPYYVFQTKTAVIGQVKIQGQYT